MTSAHRLEELRAGARYDRERRDLYRARMHGTRPASPVRLKELERACARSAARLRTAELEPGAPQKRT